MDKLLFALPVALPLLFVFICATVCHLLSWLGGWGKLSARWANPVAPQTTPQYRSGPTSGSLGWVRYNNALWYQLYPEGLRLGVYFPLRIAHPTLLIPANQINGVEVQPHWFGYSRVTLRMDDTNLKLLTRTPSQIQDWWNTSAGRPK